MTDKVIKLSSLAVDLKKEREGDWVAYPQWKGVSFKVKSPNDPEYQAARSAVLRDLAKKRQAEGVEPSDEETAKQFGELFAEHILLDWKGLDVPYSVEKALEVMTDPAFRPVQDAVANCAARVGTSEVEFLEIEAKN